MTLSEIKVSGLFGRFDHRIVLNKDERVTIMIAPNGFGKTTILRIVNFLFNRQLRRLARMPFREVSVRFDNGWVLAAERVASAAGNRKSTSEMSVSLRKNGSEEPFVLQEISPDEFPLPLGDIDEWVPGLERVGPDLWVHLESNETLSFEDVVERHGHEFPAEVAAGTGMPAWFSDLQQQISIRFVDVERLASTLPKQNFRHSRRRLRSARRAVNIYSHELGDKIRQTLAEYGSLSQSLDRTFPSRLVSQSPQSALDMGRLRIELEAVESKRRQLVGAGLLRQDDAGLNAPSPDIGDVDHSKREVLAMYAQDARKKLGVFDNVLAKVETLKRIANARFLYKQVAVSEDGIVVTTSDGQPLDLEMLSSGEQHELVLLYGLLFRVSRDALIMIDEPELSLHVAWQEKFLDDIDGIAELSGFRVLLATHSPQIIGDRYDLAIELGGPVDAVEAAARSNR